MLLMVSGVVLSFMSRNIPESFNESKFIAFSVSNLLNFPKNLSKIIS